MIATEAPATLNTAGKIADLEQAISDLTERVDALQDALAVLMEYAPRRPRVRPEPPLPSTADDPASVLFPYGWTG